MTDLSAVKVLDVTPSSIAGDRNVRAMAQALDPALLEVTQSAPLIELYSRIDELPEPILKMLAWENRVYSNEWALATTLQAKRDLVKNSFLLNQRRGTRWAVERIFSLLNINANVLEWFEYGGSPFRFRVSIGDIGGIGLTAQQLETANRMIEAYKPLRAALESIDATLDAEEVAAYAATAVTMSGVLEIFSYSVEYAESTTDTRAGVSRTFTVFLDVYPDS